MMAAVETIEVRCCCDAHLIGWLPTLGRPELGRRYRYVLTGVRSRPLNTRSSVLPLRLPELDFECEMVRDGQRTVLALKSRDYPIEQLRRIRGFRPAS